MTDSHWHFESHVDLDTHRIKVRIDDDIRRDRLASHKTGDSLTLLNDQGAVDYRLVAHPAVEDDLFDAGCGGELATRGGLFDRVEPRRRFCMCPTPIPLSRFSSLS